MEAPKFRPIVQTRSGAAVDVSDPDPKTIHLSDIAWSLSQICRFNGHTSAFYSVATHSALGARYLAGAHGRSMQRAFLLHDAAEAYLGDICRPVKKALGRVVEEMENNLLRVIFDKFGVETVPSAYLKTIDDHMLAIEARELMGEDLVGDWPVMQDTPVARAWFQSQGSAEARSLFLAVAKELKVGD